MPSFFDFLERATQSLEQNGRVSYRALQLEHGMDDQTLADLKKELVEVQQIARDVDGEYLESRTAPPILSPAPEPAEAEPSAADSLGATLESDPLEAPPTRTRPRGRFSRAVLRIGAVLVVAGVFLPWMEKSGVASPATECTGFELEEGTRILTLGLLAGVLGLFLHSGRKPRRFLSTVVAIIGVSLLVVLASVLMQMGEPTGTGDQVWSEPGDAGLGYLLAGAGALLITLGSLGALFARARS